MISYDPLHPLIFIHVPKCAGTSIRPVFEDWFGNGFSTHYFHPKDGVTKPKLVDFNSQPERVPQVVYGHFNRSRGLGIETQYPDVRQFVTILRDPLDTAISEYFYNLKRNRPISQYSPRELASWTKDLGFLPKNIRAMRTRRAKIDEFKDVEDYILRTGSNILGHFPVKMTDDNYVEVIETMFIEVGVLEHLQTSLERIAAALGRAGQVPVVSHLNKSKRNQILTPESIARFREENALAFKVYDYVNARFECEAA